MYAPVLVHVYLMAKNYVLRKSFQQFAAAYGETRSRGDVCLRAIYLSARAIAYARTARQEANDVNFRASSVSPDHTDGDLFALHLLFTSSSRPCTPGWFLLDHPGLPWSSMYYLAFRLYDIFSNTSK